LGYVQQSFRCSVLANHLHAQNRKSVTLERSIEQRKPIERNIQQITQNRERIIRNHRSPKPHEEAGGSDEENEAEEQTIDSAGQRHIPKANKSTKETTKNVPLKSSSNGLRGRL
jgi:hypothetical protein